MTGAVAWGRGGHGAPGGLSLPHVREFLASRIERGREGGGGEQKEEGEERKGEKIEIELNEKFTEKKKGKGIAMV